MTRTASCQYRGFRVVVEAEPDTVSVCHCQICQRRTGVPLTCNAYFPKSKVQLEGEHRIYTRECPEGRKLHNHFCPTCGSTVGWTLDLRPNHFGVAVGCFNDRNFPPPVASIWAQFHHAARRCGGVAAGGAWTRVRAHLSSRLLGCEPARRTASGGAVR